MTDKRKHSGTCKRFTEDTNSTLQTNFKHGNSHHLKTTIGFRDYQELQKLARVRQRSVAGEARSIVIRSILHESTY